MTANLLREELKREKEYRKKIIEEAAYGWVKENVIVINEKIDRRTVNQLIDRIQQFEDTFGPYKEKLPAISNHLDSAEKGLQLVITGKMTDKKTSNMLKHLTFLYSALADFFSRDLPVLLRAKIFDPPKKDPDRRLDMIRPMDGTRYDKKTVEAALANALKPSKEESKLLSKIYRSTALPKLDENEIATQLMSLTYNDLLELSKVGKVPMVATDDEMEGTSEEGEEGEEETESDEEGGEQAQQKEGVDQKKASIKEYKASVLLEAIDQEKLEKLNKQINQLRSVFGEFSEKMPQTNEMINNLDKRITDVLSSYKGGALNKLKGMFNKDVEAEVLNAYNMIKNFNDSWPQLVERIPEQLRDLPLANAAEMGNLSDQQAADVEKQVGQIRQLLLKAVSPKYSTVTKPPIDPETFVNELLQLPPNDVTAMVQDINTVDTQEVDPMDQGGVEAAGGQAGGQAQQGGQQGQGQAQKGGQQAAPSKEQIVNDALAAADKKGDEQAKQQATAVIDALKKAGYNVNK